ncbi:MAG: succinate-semialdehyde dehydrogenase [Candidatus Marinimicrobia bacterium]|nr:succinate-semialdehyde dehydrogenase [Candidatus Neomarinimicrobiota bacterium]|tara:strand:+ start:9485 stop:10852 length:1368 start_codon:yes stop_codon:yes gene_type:complete
MTTLKSINPATEELFAEFKEINLSSTEEIIEESSDSQRKWATVDISKRTKIISKISDFVRNNKEVFAEIITNEMGKPISESIAEVEKCAWLCDYYVENGSRFLAEQSISSDADKSFVSFEPLGVILGVMPWNFPFWQVFRFAVPAIIAGNSVLVKHAPNVQASAVAIEKVFHDCGIPKDLFRILMIDVDVIPNIISNKHVKAVSLTGSELAGSKVAECSGKNLKKTVLELGGSDAFIVLSDADLPKCIDSAVKGRMLNNGQSCIAAKRFIVHEDVYDEFIAGLQKTIESLIVGDPMLSETQVGPLAREDILNKIENQVKESIKLGAELVSGGKRVGESGYYYAPTILTNISQSMPVYNQETFGPVFSVFKFNDIDKMVELANDTDFGLGGSVWSKNKDKALSVARRIETGAVFINDFTKSDPRLPFGGVKNSGYGRELSEFGIKEFVNVKTIAVF